MSLDACRSLLDGVVPPDQHHHYLVPLILWHVMSSHGNDTPGQMKGWSCGSPTTWLRQQSDTSSLGSALQSHVETLASNIPTLRLRADYTRLDDATVRNLLERIEGIYTPEDTADTVGGFYEALVADTMDAYGVHFTPRHVIEMMVRLLDPDPHEGASVHDPTCGSGRMLTTMASQVDTKEWSWSGQDVVDDIAAMALVQTAVAGIDADIRTGDVLADPAFTDGPNTLTSFDYILANIPFSASWPKDELAEDRYNRFDWLAKRPHQQRGDYAFLMHIDAIMDDSCGQAAVIVPRGTLVRKYERRYRRHILETGWLDGVVNLPPGLFETTDAPATLLVASRRDRAGCHMIHLDDSDCVRKGTTHQLSSSVVDDVVDGVLRDTGAGCRVALETLDDRDYLLDPALYDQTSSDVDTSLTSEIETLHSLNEECRRLEDQLETELKAQGVYPDE